jgi:methyl-accepting chemotaxis protein
MNIFNVSTWFKGIKTKLLFAALIPIVGFLAVFAVARGGIQRSDTLIKIAHETLIPNSIYLGDMRVARNKFIGKAYETIVHTEAPEKRKKSLASMRDGAKEFAAAYDVYAKAPFIAGEAEIHDKVKGQIPEFNQLMIQIADLLETNEPEKNKQALEMLTGRLATLGSAVRDFNLDVSKIYDIEVERQVKEAATTRKEVTMWLMMITICSALSIFGLLFWIASNVTNSVGGIADRLAVASSSVASSVRQLTNAGSHLSQSSTQAAASLQETVASIEELTSMVQRNSDNAKQAADLSGLSRESAEAGEKEIIHLIDSMNEISSSSKKIEEIISVIDDISFQTNLLALNAAVEAARAGEQGKGFAVVAEAVRTLAHKSAISAKDISTLIQDSVRQIEKGSSIADKSGEVLAKIVTSIKKVSELNNEISTASTEQTIGIQQISKAMNQLDQAAQTNANSAQEVAAVGEGLDQLAVTAQKLTLELNSTVLGHDKSAAA